MAYQFIRIEAVSRAGRDLYSNRKGGKIKVGSISTESVLGEAERLEPFISHIEHSLQPVIVFGDKEKGIGAVRQRIKEWVDGTKDAQNHKIRDDALCLLAGVISWPPKEKDENEKEYMEKMLKFEIEMILWLKKIYREDLILVIRHDDEPFRGKNAGSIHYHWHFYSVKKPGQKFDLHPGFAARAKKNIPYQERKRMSADEIKKAMKEGRKAYLDAMVTFQNRFYNELAIFYRLNRKGEGRIRRSPYEQAEYEKLVEDQISATKNARIMGNKIMIEANKNKESIIREAKIQAETVIKTAEITAADINKKLKEKEKKLNKMEMDVKDEAKRNRIFFTHLEETQKRTIKLIQKKLSESEIGKSILHWIWPKLANLPKEHSKTTNTNAVEFIDEKKVKTPSR